MATTSIHSISATQVRALSYITNNKKTMNGSLIDSYMCSKNADEAAKDFERVQQQIGSGRSKVLAQHIIMSFKPQEITPQKALELGQALCDRFLKEQYQYVIAVHTDKKHIHCHIVFNNTNFENGKTFETLENKGRNNQSWKKLRNISDDICKANELSVIVDPEQNKGKSWWEWDKNRQGISWKSKLKYELDDCVMNSDNFDDFLQKVRLKNIQVVYNPEHKIDLKFRMEGQEKWSRARTLGWYYETPQIKKRIEQYKIFRTGEYGRRQRTKIIDTSTEKMQANKGLELWANIQNMKEASRVINILTQLGVSSSEQIEEKSILEFAERMNLIKQLNEIQGKIDSVSQTISNVRMYKKYKPIYDEYKKTRNDKSRKKYAEKYAADIEKYKSASSYLKEQYPSGKVPSEEKLTALRKELSEQRSELNEKFKIVCQQIKDLDYARQTIEDYLKNEEQTQNRKKSELT